MKDTIVSYDLLLGVNGTVGGGGGDGHGSRDTIGKGSWNESEEPIDWRATHSMCFRDSFFIELLMEGMTE